MESDRLDDVDCFNFFKKLVRVSMCCLTSGGQVEVKNSAPSSDLKKIQSLKIKVLKARNRGSRRQKRKRLRGGRRKRKKKMRTENVRVIPWLGAINQQLVESEALGIKNWRWKSYRQLESSLSFELFFFITWRHEPRLVFHFASEKTHCAEVQHSWNKWSTEQALREKDHVRQCDQNHSWRRHNTAPLKVRDSKRKMLGLYIYNTCISSWLQSHIKNLLSSDPQESITKWLVDECRHLNSDYVKLYTNDSELEHTLLTHELLAP